MNKAGALGEREAQPARSTAQSRPEGKIQLETRDLLLRKARRQDWRQMYRNLWSRPEAARYMLWRTTDSEQEAQARMERTVEFQRDHDVYLVVEKKSGQAIGFAGLEQIGPQSFQETGVALGPDFTGRGYGKQVLALLLAWAAAAGGREFFYCTRAENQASLGLARSLGFQYLDCETKTDPRTGREYRLERWRRRLP